MSQQIIDSLVTAARADGLTPVVEGESSVDLRVMDGDRVIAAIRVHINGDRCVHEIPARPGVSDLSTGYLIQPWATGPFETQHMRDLNLWWSRIPATGRSWKPTRQPWMIPGYWERRGILRPEQTTRMSAS